MEPVRPLPAPAIRERVSAYLEFFRLSRLIAVAGSVALVAAGAWWLLKSPPPPVEARLPMAGQSQIAGAPPSESPSTVPAPAPSAAPTPGATVAPTVVPSTIVVQVAGAVAHPGVFPVAVGARVNDALAAAGGPVRGADPQQLSLAAIVTDGERIYVPRIGEPPPTRATPPRPTDGGSAGRPSSAAPSSPLDINEASAEELDALPGIGPATAAAIVAFREEHGPFASVDDLLEVRGIGPAKLDAFRSLVVV